MGHSFPIGMATGYSEVEIDNGEYMVYRHDFNQGFSLAPSNNGTAVIWWVNFGPSIGGEIRKKRPAIIVSNDAANKFLNRVQVVPLTSKADRLYPS